MHFYVWFEEVEGVETPVGWLQTDEYRYYPRAREVSEEEFVKYGGIVRELVKEPTVPERVADLEEENKMLKAQVQAASDYSDFLEECIVEMAMKVYE